MTNPTHSNTDKGELDPLKQASALFDNWIDGDGLARQEFLAQFGLIIEQQCKPLKVEIAFWKGIVRETSGYEYYKAVDEAYDFERKAQAKETEKES